MKLLILTQKVDRLDPVLGFFHRWIEEFAKHAERVTVVCLEKGEYDLPKNVRVLSLGKESGASRAAYIKNFYTYIWAYRHDHDSVFVHMNQVYVLLGGLLWRAWHKRIGLWYVHRQTSTSLWWAEKLTNIIFTSSSESFRLKSSKVRYVGHGIDTQIFTADQHTARKDVVHVGRITPIKKLETILAAYALLDPQVVGNLKFAGEPVTKSDIAYRQRLVIQSRELGIEDRVEWLGARQASEMFKHARLSVNAAPSGGMDKAVLESLAAGCPVFASNTAFEKVFGTYKSIFMFTSESSKDLARKIGVFLEMFGTEEVMNTLTRKIHEEYDVRVLIGKITVELS